MDFAVQSAKYDYASLLDVSCNRRPETIRSLRQTVSMITVIGVGLKPL
jgi:hypothetical protein